MLDSVRSRLTLWYSALFGLFLILLAGLTYFLYWRNSVEHLDANLLELSDTYIATFNAELRDDDQQEGGVRAAAQAAMLEHRFRDVVYAIVDDQGRILSSSLDLPAASESREKITPRIFSAPEFQELAQTALGTTTGVYRRVRGGMNGFRGYARTLPGNRNLTLVVLQSLHPQHEMMEVIRICETRS